MREGSVHELIRKASDMERASFVESLWEARGYETALRFSGPDVHVEAVGETPEGARVTVWGVVRGETRGTRYDRSLPLLETLDVARTEA